MTYQPMRSGVAVGDQLAEGGVGELAVGELLFGADENEFGIGDEALFAVLECGFVSGGVQRGAWAAD